MRKVYKYKLYGNSDENVVVCLSRAEFAPTDWTGEERQLISVEKRMKEVIAWSHNNQFSQFDWVRRSVKIANCWFCTVLFYISKFSNSINLAP